MKILFSLIVVSAVLVVTSCKTNKVPESAEMSSASPDGCPYQGLKFTEATDSDSLERTLTFNDSLKIDLDADIQKFEANGTLGNNLQVNIEKTIIKSRTRTYSFSADYLEAYNRYITILCGASKQYEIYQKQRKKDPAMKEIIISQLQKASDAMLNYSEKKRI